MKRLSLLTVFDTKLSGTRSSECLDKRDELVTLQLDKTSLSGTLSSEVDSLSDLKLLTLSDTEMSGTLPREVRALPSHFTCTPTRPSWVCKRCQHVGR